jgi:hypothetical protein
MDPGTRPRESDTDELRLIGLSFISRLSTEAAYGILHNHILAPAYWWHTGIL